MTYMPTYYEILGLPSALHNEPNLPAQTLRTAYRRALLQNHPDKSSANNALNSKTTIYSIDQISEAFNTLSHPQSRTKYDQELKLQNATTEQGGVMGKQVFRTGIETVDLDDLEVDEAQSIWYRSCRCGDERGFLIKEADLEEAAEDGEISVGCKGCSLWLKVLFGVMEEA
ncbi:diphthamide biosynthesis protein-like protein 4 [Rhexocercosporidium sp. MPI-PUGE-AT-0058]|nr:diphthamide biosynthesis protein-like protein 4 [Rhexocercosporidium sp. MPI-PUGE-AT-0058]